MIFQSFSLLERLTVYENVALPMVCWNYPKNVIDKRVKELLELVGIIDKINEKPRNLSGGQKQRVVIARALTLGPKILLCDEATSALDPKTTLAILRLLREINENLGITMVVMTHQMEVVRQICNRVCILENGKIVEEGPVQEVFLRQSSALKRFLGEEEIIVSDVGKNIRVLITDYADYNRILTQMAIDLNITFPIVEGKMENYRDDILGSFVLNLTDEQYTLVVNYLDDRKIIWKDIKA